MLISTNTINKNQTGFSVIEALLVVVIIIAIGGVGFFVWHSKQTADKTLAPTNSASPKFKNNAKSKTTSSKTTVSASKLVSLASGNVTLSMPSDWVETSAPNSSCDGGSIGSTAVCVSGGNVVVTPSSLNTPNNPFSGVNLSVFKHNDSSTAEQWLSNVYGGFNDTTNPKSIDESSESINGYNAFSYESQFVADSTTPNQHFLEVYYVIVHDSYAVVVTSQVENTTNITSDSSNNVINDYTQYLPTIK